MAYHGYQTLDTGEIDDFAGTYPVRLYFDFDTEDEAYAFDNLINNSEVFDNEVKRLAELAVEQAKQEL